ncbi:putative GMP synthase [glutamine-hydrolyzing], partial [Cytospora mali]
PLPPNPSRRPIPTARLLLRPFHPTDLASFHALQRQPEVMCWTSKGRPDADEAETARKLAQFLPPNDARTFNWAIYLRESGGLIGVGGVHDFGGGGAAAADGDSGGDDDNGGFGWPEIGYLLRREYWGKGYGTEFLRAFLGVWEGELLRREVVERRVKVGSFERVGGGGGGNDNGPVLGREQLVAIIDRRNAASRKILEKCGFESFADFEEEDSCDPEKVIELVAYRYFPKVAS